MITHDDVVMDNGGDGAEAIPLWKSKRNGTYCNPLFLQRNESNEVFCLTHNYECVSAVT